jgi:hypothetical protein
MRVILRFALFAIPLIVSSVPVTLASEEPRAVVYVSLSSSTWSRAQTVIFAIKPGAETLLPTRYPRLKILIMQPEKETVPIQISLVAESGQVLSSTTVDYSAEVGAEFSLSADGIEAEGKISAPEQATSGRFR